MRARVGILDCLPPRKDEEVPAFRTLLPWYVGVTVTAVVLWLLLR